MKKEFRNAEARAEVDEKTREIVGRIPFDSETVIGGYFREVIRPGFFARAIADGDDVVARVEHGMHGELPFARVKSGNLTLTETADYMEWRAQPIDAPDVTSLMARLESGDGSAPVMDGTSFAFRVEDSDPEQVRWHDSEDGMLPLRELISAKQVSDVSPVTFAAYEGTSVGLRSAETIFNEYVTSTGADEPKPSDDDAQRAAAPKPVDEGEIADVVDMLLTL